MHNVASKYVRDRYVVLVQSVVLVGIHVLLMYCVYTTHT